MPIGSQAQIYLFPVFTCIKRVVSALFSFALPAVCRRNDHYNTEKNDKDVIMMKIKSFERQNVICNFNVWETCLCVVLRLD